MVISIAKQNMTREKYITHILKETVKCAGDTEYANDAILYDTKPKK